MAAAEKRQRRKAVRRFNKVPADPKADVLPIIIRQTTESTTDNGSGEKKSLPLGFLCKFCCEIFELPEFLDDHLTTLHNKSRSNNTQQIVADAAVKFSDKTAADPLNGLRTPKSSSTRHKVCTRTHRGFNGPPSHGWFPCPHCDYTSKQRNGLNIHIAFIHEGRRYKCDHCEATYSSKNSLLRHVKIKHDDDDDAGNAPCPDRRRKSRKRHRPLTEQHNNNASSNDTLNYIDDHGVDQQPSSSKKRRA